MRSGSLLPGNENDAQAYHDVHLLAPAGRRMQGGRRWRRRDSSYLPHHSIPPIRSWPGPRIVWNCVSERITPVLQRSGQVPLLIGCDCSVVDRTTQALLHASSQEIHILHIDGDFDDSPPDGRRSQIAASCAVGLLMNNSPFWAGSALRPDVCGGGNHDDVRVGGAPAAGGARGECRSGCCAADGIKFDTVPPRGS